MPATGLVTKHARVNREISSLAPSCFPKHLRLSAILTWRPWWEHCPISENPPYPPCWLSLPSGKRCAEGRPRSTKVGMSCSRIAECRWRASRSLSLPLCIPVSFSNSLSYAHTCTHACTHTHTRTLTTSLPTGSNPCSPLELKPFCGLSRDPYVHSLQQL